jgi:glucoamylase
MLTLSTWCDPEAITKRSGQSDCASFLRSLVTIIVSLSLLALALAGQARAAEAPGAPGVGSSWTRGAKDGVGTSANGASKVWFAIGEGILHEVYFPLIDNANNQDLQLVIVKPGVSVELERDATQHRVSLTEPFLYIQVNEKPGHYRITKRYVTDSNRPTLLIETRFEELGGGPYDVYVLYNPSLNGSGNRDTAATQGNGLVSSDGGVASALVVSSGFTRRSSGYSGSSSDGLRDLFDNKQLDNEFDSALSPGNIVQIGQIPVGGDTTFVLASGYGDNRDHALATANASLGSPFSNHVTAYQGAWTAYLSPLTVPASVASDPDLLKQYKVALVSLKALEDKTHHGASIASLATPWGQVRNGNDLCGPHTECATGYQAVWARDLYQVATALNAAGDTASANAMLDYLLNVQRRSDGSMPQNTRVNGASTTFGSLQMDEVAFPIILAWQLRRTDAATYAKLKPLAEFILHNGPGTPQERWEEERGISASTLAAEIAGLVTAADIADQNNDPGAANAYLAKADDWHSNIENWLFTTSGPLGDGRYFFRINNNDNPNDGALLEINNGGGTHDERSIMDAGFLEFVRLGIKAADDPEIVASVPELDATLRKTTPAGDMFYRYNHDGYGESDDCRPFIDAGIGRLWPLLSGERGEYELARGNIASAEAMLTAMAATHNDGFMLAEQIWDRPDGCGKFTFGKGTDSATPLAWSMAQFVRMALSIDAGKPVDTPQVVADRYVGP